ncbi:DotI/IcmL/TraM family protein [Paralysiella testudinis]|uniref:DotI/IcmL/TraM family protein n=1 Tax=Paralysiella testudinis TaxID=2809020 RepID=A0A892ZMT1_9NEIS|nr:DotI/IcmL/TraM family protein [Paralysiella testudinis]QRQ83006.1 DotI/IcmL/TraM family protein [Paralysiella testudinis]
MSAEDKDLEKDLPDSAKQDEPDEDSHEGNISDKELEKRALVEQYLTPPTSPLEQVIAENAELKLALLQAKSSNKRIWTLVALMALLVGVVVYTWVAVFPKYKYIATTDNRAICQAAASDNPLVTPATLAAYAQEAVVNSYTYDYVNYREDLNRIGNTYYTDNGRAAYFNSHP